MIQYSVVWITAVVVFAAVEGLTAQLVSVWFAVGAVGAFVAAACGFSLPVQITVFLVLSGVCAAATRPLFKKLLKGRIEKTNADALIDKTALVVSDINNIAECGSVKINGLEWSARSANDEVITAGEIVVIEKISGVKLIVRKCRADAEISEKAVL